MFKSFTGSFIRLFPDRIFFFCFTWMHCTYCCIWFLINSCRTRKLCSCCVTLKQNIIGSVISVFQRRREALSVFNVKTHRTPGTGPLCTTADNSINQLRKCIFRSTANPVQPQSKGFTLQIWVNPHFLQTCGYIKVIHHLDRQELDDWE